MIDFTTITACGECCIGCTKKENEICPGCIEADGKVPAKLMQVPFLMS